MQLSALVPHIKLSAESDREITRLVLNSQLVKPKDAFVAINGVTNDGRLFVEQAIINGASAVFIDTDQKNASVGLKDGVPIIPIHDLKKHLGLLASFFYGHPSMKLPIFGVTGTNGKTSCTHFLADMIEQLGHACGVIGTLGAGFYGQLVDTGLTTPDAVSLQEMLAELVEKKAKAVTMEVSSHSIDQCRVNGVLVDIAIFTNLSQDHLDYHGDMESYANVKRSFLSSEFTNDVVINVDDAYGAKWADDLARDKTIYAYGIKPYSGQLPGSFVKKITAVNGGLQVSLDTSWGKADVLMPVVGEFNVSNLLAAITTLCVYGVPFEKVMTLLPHVKSIPGRMQRLGGGDKPTVIVDYAHTPDALEKALKALKPQVTGKLICVFGCGGERDAQKRFLMAKVAEKWADESVVTNDNPRNEDPQSIAQAILSGFEKASEVNVELDRSKAITNSIQCAVAGDCILIAGKGAEQYQQVGQNKNPFSDVAEAEKALSSM